MPRFLTALIALTSVLYCSQFSPAAVAPGQQAPGAIDGPPDPTLKSKAQRLLAAMDPQASIDSRVGRLIDRLVMNDRDEVQAAVTALLILGRPAVPAIIRRIDDRREMKVKSVAFENRAPDAFEAVRQYAVAVVVDCLDDVLGEITGESLGLPYVDLDVPGKDIGTEASARRDAIVAAWRGYVPRGRMLPPVPGKSLPPAKSPNLR